MRRATRSHSSDRARGAGNPRRLRLEALEQRCLLAIDTWTGAAGNGDWFTAGNWSSGVPGSADDAVFNAAATVKLTAAPDFGFGELSVNGAAVTINLHGNNFSMWTVNVGGAASLTLTNDAAGPAGGPRFSCAHIFDIAPTSTSAATVSLTGTLPATLNVVDQLRVGDAGGGTLSVQGKWCVQFHNMVVGDKKGSVGVVNVTGNGGIVGYTNSKLFVGDGGEGRLTVQGGGVAAADYVRCADGPGSRAIVLLPNQGAFTAAKLLDVGDGNGSNATIDVGQGSALKVVNGVLARFGSGANSKVEVTLSSNGYLATNALVVSVGDGPGSNASVALHDAARWDVGLAGTGWRTLHIGRDGGGLGYGQVQVDHGTTLRAQIVFVHEMGLLSGDGTVVDPTTGRRRVVNHGKVKVADSQSPGVGTMSAEDEYTNGPDGALDIAVAAAGGSDTLAVDGDVSLAGTLGVSELAGFVPQLGQQFVVMTYTGGLAGEFSQVEAPPLPPGWEWHVDYSTAGDVILQILDPAGQPVSATEGEATPSNTVVATIGGVADAADAASFTATINWGDGTTPTTNVAATYVAATNEADIDGGHTYAEEGKYAVVVSIDDGGEPFAVVDSTATVGDAALNNLVVTSNLTADEGQVFSVSPSGPLATFTDTNPTPDSNDYTATVDWDYPDGPSCVASVAMSQGTGVVSGTHTYTTPGAHHICVTVNDVGGSTAQATGTITVNDTDNSLSIYGREIDATPGTPFSGIVADFVDEAPQDPGTYDATINWGDGTGPSGIIASLAGAGWAKVVPRATPGARRARRGIVRRRRGERVVVPSAA